jgi:transposase-like protein
MDAVLRLLRGEPLEALSRELGVEAHRLAAWRDDFLESGKQGLKGQRPDRSQEDRQLKEAERKVGQLTMENEILRAAAEKGAADPAGEAAQIAMDHRLPIAMVCRVLGASAPASTPAGPGPMTTAGPARRPRSATPAWPG